MTTWNLSRWSKLRSSVIVLLLFHRIEAIYSIRRPLSAQMSDWLILPYSWVNLLWSIDNSWRNERYCVCPLVKNTHNLPHLYATHPVAPALATASKTPQSGSLICLLISEDKCILPRLQSNDGNLQRWRNQSAFTVRITPDSTFFRADETWCLKSNFYHLSDRLLHPRKKSLGYVVTRLVLA
jgi:hypothetical protein